MKKELGNRFFKTEGPILETYLECGITVTSATYCDIFQRGLKPAIHSKRSGRLSEGMTVPVPILRPAC
jgi:hypothetical protein